jgi:hypothetical protein
MAKSVRFWTIPGMEVTYGGPEAPFTSLCMGRDYVNLVSDEGPEPGFWGRVIIHVPDPDALWRSFGEAGFGSLTEPEDAPWGERYFHIVDPGGHEISFAKPLPPIGTAAT